MSFLASYLVCAAGILLASRVLQRDGSGRPFSACALLYAALAGLPIGWCFRVLF